MGDDIIFSFICDNYFFSKDTFNYIVDNRLFISSNNKLYFVEELNNLEQIDLLNKSLEIASEHLDVLKHPEKYSLSLDDDEDTE